MTPWLMMATSIRSDTEREGVSLPGNYLKGDEAEWQEEDSWVVFWGPRRLRGWWCWLTALTSAHQVLAVSQPFRPLLCRWMVAGRPPHLDSSSSCSACLLFSSFHFSPSRPVCLPLFACRLFIHLQRLHFSTWLDFFIFLSYIYIYVCMHICVCLCLCLFVCLPARKCECVCYPHINGAHLSTCPGLGLNVSSLD